jgi:uncharacterized protein YraI
MRITTVLVQAMASAALAAVLATASTAQTVRTDTVAPAAARGGTVVSGTLRGDDTAEYVVAAETGQILSVDLVASNGALYFNILPKGAPEAIFIGSSAGNVADVPVPAAGDYVIQVYLMRSAARRDERSDYTLGIGLAGADFADGLAGGPDWWQVSGIAADSALNIRSGPATRHDVVGKAQNGEVMQNRGCRMTGAERWCSIRTVGSGVQGWVAGRFLTEAAAPQAAEMPEGGPVGNGTGFDATGSIPCALAAGQTSGSCLFGVVREGPGNAGVWIAIGAGAERQILFEGGVPVSANLDAPLSFEKSADLFMVRVGEERYEIPEAVVNGG